MTVKFAIVGCGSIAHTHAHALEGIPKAKLIAVYSRNMLTAKAFADTYHCRAYSDYAALINDKNIDCIVFCTPSGLHAEMAVQAAAAQKHVVVEKPIDITLEKADLLIETAEKHNVKLAVVFQRRFSKDIQKLKNMLMQNKLGKIYYCGCYVKWYRSEEYYKSAAWRGTWELDGGGVLMNQAIHFIDILHYLLGDIKEVSAQCVTLGHDIPVEDVAVAALKYQNGALGVIEATTAAYPGIGARIDIFGEQGTVIWENDEIVYCAIKGRNVDNSVNKSTNTGAASPGIGFMLHQQFYLRMIDAINLNCEVPVSGRDGKKALATVLAIYKSAREGKKVELQEK